MERSGVDGGRNGNRGGCCEGEMMDDRSHKPYDACEKFREVTRLL
jgi:hypothetical protein